MSYLHDTEHTFGTIVYHQISCECGMITGIKLNPGGVKYRVSWGGGGDTWNHAIELSLTRGDQAADGGEDGTEEAY